MGSCFRRQPSVSCGRTCARLELSIVDCIRWERPNGEPFKARSYAPANNAGLTPVNASHAGGRQAVAPIQPLRSLQDDRGLAGRIVEQIAEAIVEGRFAEGAKLTESELSQAFGTSRTPVRDALRILAQDGLVVLLPRKGARVVTFGPHWTAHVYVCRAYLQGLAAKMAAPRLTPDDFQDLRGLLDEMQRAAETGDSARHYHATVPWHSRLAARAGNDPLEHMMASLGRRVQRLRYIASEIPGQIERSARRHRQLYRALEARDAGEAERIVRLTIAEAGEAVLMHRFGLTVRDVAEFPFNLTHLVANSYGHDHLVLRGGKEPS